MIDTFIPSSTSLASGLQGILAASSDRQLATNVSKADACAENDAGNPGANRNTLLCDSGSDCVFPSSSIQ